MGGGEDEEEVKGGKVELKGLCRPGHSSVHPPGGVGGPGVEASSRIVLFALRFGLTCRGIG